MHYWKRFNGISPLKLDKLTIEAVADVARLQVYKPISLKSGDISYVCTQRFPALSERVASYPLWITQHP